MDQHEVRSRACAMRLTIDLALGLGTVIHDYLDS
jgi:acetoacetate decarboxylase